MDLVRNSGIEPDFSASKA